MVRFLAGRLAQFAVTLLGITLVTFTIAHLVPGEPITGAPGEAGVSQESIAELRRTLGYDQPVPVQYLGWLGRVIRLDFGSSSRDGRAVSAKLRDAAPVTVVLGLLALLLVVAVGIPVGVHAGLHPGSPFELMTRTAVLLLHSVPNFVLAVLLLGWVGSSGWLPEVPFDAGVPSLWAVLELGRGLVAPVLCLAVGALAIVAGQVAGSLREVMATDYIRAARSRGLRERDVVLRHALPNAAAPTLNTLGTLVPHLVGGSVIVESIFGLPGLGQLGFQALSTRDYDTLMGVTVLGALVTLLANLLADLITHVIDPRMGDVVGS